MGSISSPFSSRSTEPQDGLLSAENAGPSTGRPTNNRSQSALLPLRPISTCVTEEAGPTTAAGHEVTSSTGESARARNRSHTVSVAFASGRKGTQTQTARGRRRSSVSNNRSMEEGRMSQSSDRAGSGVAFELGGEDHDLDDNAVGVLDCIDPEVSTGEHVGSLIIY